MTSVLTVKKVEQTDNKQFFLDPSENQGQRENCYPQNWRQIYRITASWSVSPPLKPVMSIKLIDELLEAQCRQT